MYIHKTVCISPQHTFSEVDLENTVTVEGTKLVVIEPPYPDIPLNILRRMGKAVRMGVGAAITLLKEYPHLNGIIIGTANGGMEDCILFLNQIIDYSEGTLTPKNFVQSTTNAIAAQIGLNANNKEYNITHVHRGLAFENALLDVKMLLSENIESTYLLGGVDEISSYNYNIENLSGWYKKKPVSNEELYDTNTEGSIAGEGVAMFIANNSAAHAIAKVKDVKLLHTSDEGEVTSQLKIFLGKNLTEVNEIDLYLSGENGDTRLNHFYHACESLFIQTTIARFKQLCGEYPTATSFALWLGCLILDKQQLPKGIIKKNKNKKEIKNILIYNNYKGEQHSFILVEKTFT